MTHPKTWILTDLANHVWQDTFAVNSNDFGIPSPPLWSIHKRTLGGGLADGIDLIEVSNGDLSFAVLPTRGMGLWRGRFRDHFLGWQAPVVGPVHPKFVPLDDRGGLGWLYGFDEWLCRCGLTSNGPPGEDVVTDAAGATRRTRLTLHGRIANQPAHFVEVRVNPEPPHELSVTGQVEESGLFFPRLRLTATFTTLPGSNRLTVHDVVENRATQPAEMQMLYHLNVGPPFLEAGSRVKAPFREVAPLTGRAAEGIDTFEVYEAPSAGFAEQVYCYDLQADATGRTLALLHNAAGDLGLAVWVNRTELPCFVVWKNTAAVEDGYVTGLEPGTNYPNFKGFERQQGRVIVLPPGGRWECRWEIEVLDTKEGVAGILAEIDALQRQGKLVIHRTPQPRYSPGV